MQETQVQSLEPARVQGPEGLDFGSVSTTYETLGEASQIKNARNYFQLSSPHQWKHMHHAELRQTQSPQLLIFSLLTTVTLFPVPLAIQSHLLFHVPWQRCNRDVDSMAHRFKGETPATHPHGVTQVQDLHANIVHAKLSLVCCPIF